MDQLHAVAYAAFEEHFAGGTATARGKVWDHLIAVDLEREHPSDDPFGPDPAMLASIGRGDSDTYRSPATTDATGDTLPAPVNAAGAR